MRKVVSCNPPSLEPFFTYNTYTNAVPRVPTRRDCLAGWRCTTGVVIAPHSGGRKRRDGALSKAENANQTTLHSESLFRVNTYMIVKQVTRGGRTYLVSQLFCTSQKSVSVARHLFLT